VRGYAREGITYSTLDIYQENRPLDISLIFRNRQEMELFLSK